MNQRKEEDLVYAKKGNAHSNKRKIWTIIENLKDNRSPRPTEITATILKVGGIKLPDQAYELFKI